MTDHSTEAGAPRGAPPARHNDDPQSVQLARGGRWFWGITSIATLVVIFFALQHFDVALMRGRYALIGDHPRGFLRQLLGGFREFGQSFTVVVAIVIVITYDRRWKTIVTSLLLAELLGAMAYNPAKLCIVRYRPQIAITKLADRPTDNKVQALSTFTSADTWLGFRPGNGQADRQSFPSGHSAGAFVLAGVLAWFYPRLRILLWTLAVGCALSRYLDAVHWLSDCWAGAVIGYLAAWMAIRLGMRILPGWKRGRSTLSSYSCLIAHFLTRSIAEK